MEGEPGISAEERIEKWYNELRSVNAMTETDCYVYKSHLLDTMDELKASGLNEIQAFEEALESTRNFNFEKEYGIVNADTLLVRKIILILSGILGFFSLYFLMYVSTRAIFLYLVSVHAHPPRIRSVTFIFLTAYHLLTIALIILLRYKLLKKQNFYIRPDHIFLMVLVVFLFGFTAFKLNEIIIVLSSRVILSTNYFSSIFYAGYLYPFVISISIIFLYWKKLALIRENLFGSIKRENELIKEGKLAKTTKIAFSGILIYLFFYFLLHATTGALLIVLQYFENNPLKNLGWIKWYIASFHLCLIFFTISVYIRDDNLIYRLKKISFGKIKIWGLLVITVLLSLLDRFSHMKARNSLGSIFEYKSIFLNILQYSDLSFSCLLMLCFLLLFNKYYKENMRLH